MRKNDKTKKELLPNFYCLMKNTLQSSNDIVPPITSNNKVDKSGLPRKFGWETDAAKFELTNPFGIALNLGYADNLFTFKRYLAIIPVPYRYFVIAYALAAYDILKKDASKYMDLDINYSSIFLIKHARGHHVLVHQESRIKLVDKNGVLLTNSSDFTILREHYVGEMLPFRVELISNDGQLLNEERELRKAALHAIAEMTGLTKCRQEICKLLLKNYSNEGIALHLGNKKTTIAKHTSDITQIGKIHFGETEPTSALKVAQLLNDLGLWDEPPK